MELHDLAERFYRIFAGNKRGHGQYTIQGHKGLKATGKAKTVAAPATIDLWEQHLYGEQGIGIVPIMENGSCTWGAVDIDEYEGLDLEELSHKLPAPLVMCRTKSGGVHIYIFLKTPTSASLMRKKLMMVAKSLGHSDAEIFPKQDKLNEGDIGNWINMPYFKHDATTRYCIRGGVSLTAEEFVEFVSERSITQEELVSFQMQSIFEPGDDPEFLDAPPCLQYYVKHGFPPGSRNSALFSMGVFARKKFSTGWEDKVFEYNQRFMGPGKYSEVAGIIRSLNKKTYVYKCKDQPLISACDKEACANCPFGVQPSIQEDKALRPCVLDLVERPVICYEPPIGSKDEPYWVFTIDGQDFDVTLEMAYSQPKFNREFSRIFKKIVLPVKDTKWVKLINEILADAEIHELGADAGPEGRFWQYLEEFCAVKVQAKTKDELILGKPWYHEGRIYFRLNDLNKYLDQQRFRDFSPNQIVQIIKRRDAKHHDFVLKGKHVNCWSIGQFDVQNEPFDKESIKDDAPY